MIATMPMTTAIYGAVLALLGAALTVNVIVMRVRGKIFAGDGGIAYVAQAIRAHGNFIEQAPLGLILVAFAEAAGARQLVVHILCIGLVAGRLASAYALNCTLELSVLRQIGASLAILVLVGAAAAIIVG
jgi:uncharacterized membrane protein YecN with MAPEG domain